MSDSIDRVQAMTELQMSAKRLTLAYEAHGEGRVEYSDIIIRLSDALDTLRGLPSAQPEQHTCVNCGRTVNTSNKGSNKNNSQRGTNVPSQPTVPSMPKVKPTTPNK